MADGDVHGHSLASLAMSTLRPEDRTACAHFEHPSALGLPKQEAGLILRPRPPLAQRLLWITAIAPPLSSSDEVGRQYFQLAKVATMSARLYAPSLQPHLMYLTDCVDSNRTCGQPDAISRWMLSHGVHVHFWRLSFWASLPKDRKTTRNPMTFNSYGTYAKLDVPLLVEQLRRSRSDSLPPTEYVLYTDLDVMFTSDPSLGLHALLPRIFAAVPDLLADGINSGVMLINTNGFSQQHKALIEYAKRHEYRIPLMEQGLL